MIFYRLYEHRGTEGNNETDSHYLTGVGQKMNDWNEFALCVQGICRRHV